ncbi:YjjG family noncanonical pyrimidine nucleotidase [Ancylomarina sp. 16SWW S1-10-2]|uniref:YjjG family noncanonical pyrimidine nucleotidase n=1 Tax=Ancylomarina sp. 16SWW S1-10-2 TaxID=2499681 RepID=UPI0012AD4273|nr:YjjG family noncanonical pyrimidine nucleotidase [Ancylomarina sp. 16SWW S1-10-2]MRT94528.1 noncanonical pyrimidine nucleotidase, YjjG family [Ancylomarina sp. 16SWW S1-10-2]
MKYKHIFFDLDRTLWDFDKNSEKTLKQLYRDFGLQNTFGNFLFFKERYEYHNKKLWIAYYQKRIEKEELSYRRFYITLKEAGQDDIELAKEIAQEFLDLSPLQTEIFPNTHSCLDYLKSKAYKLHIITNGFNEVQGRKLQNSKLDSYFTKVITSEDAGANKPHAQIFEFALNQTGAKPDECIMIGDDLNTDIKGARNMGMDSIYFNPKKIKHTEKVTFEVENLKELIDIL